MMYYCSQCKSPTPAETCPNCGKKKLATICDSDLCFLCNKKSMWSEMLREVLRNNGIPHTYEPLLGTAVSLETGTAFESHLIYVPYQFLEEAQTLLTELFQE